MRKSTNFLILPLLSILIFSNPIYSQWSPTYPCGGSFTAVAANGTTFYAGSLMGSLYMTTNNGTNWAQIGSNQNFGNINCLLLNGSNLYVGCFNGLFLTSNNGNTWRTIKTSGSSATMITALAIIGDNLYVGTNGGLFLSQIDIWTALSSGLPADGINSIVVSGTNLFVSTSFNGVYTSTDNGTTWTAFKNGLPSHTNFFSLGVGTNYLYVGTNQGTYRTPLNSNSWVNVTNQSNGAPCFSFAFYDKYIFAGVQEGGVMISSDQGTTWQDFNTGMPLYSSQSITLSGVFNTAHSLAVGSNYMLAATDNGIFSLAVLATTWNSVDSGLNAGSLTSLLFSGSKIYAGTSKGGFFFSSDNGNSWYNYNAGLRTSDNLNCLGWYGSNVYTYVGSSGPLILEDTDMRWIGTDSLNSVNTTFWSILIYNSEIYIGSDNGVWTANLNYKGFKKISSGLPTGAIYSLIAAGNNLFAGMQNNGVYLSTDNGITWTAVNSGISNLTIHSLLSTGSNIFAGADAGSALYLTTNNGTTWTPVNNGLNAPRVFSLAVSGNYIFAGTGNGVYISANNGSSWKAVNNSNMANQNIYSLLVIGDYLYAGGDNIVYKRPISEMTAVENKDVLPTTIELSQNYPNPFNPTTTISYSIPSYSFITIKIIDVLGRAIQTLVNEEKPGGNYKIEFDGSKLTSGIYFYSLSAKPVDGGDEFRETRKMCLMK